MLIHNFGGQVQVVLETNSWIFTKRAKSQLKSRLNYRVVVLRCYYSMRKGEEEIEGLHHHSCSIFDSIKKQ